MKWTFADNNGGEEGGFHHAGVETFKGNFERYLAREVIQNSLDARANHKSPVTVNFERLDLKAADVPDADGLGAAFCLCAKYWNDDEKARLFFKRAEKLLKATTVTALRIGDYNTTGVLAMSATSRAAAAASSSGEYASPTLCAAAFNARAAIARRTCSM